MQEREDLLKVYFAAKADEREKSLLHFSPYSTHLFNIAGKRFLGRAAGRFNSVFALTASIIDYPNKKESQWKVNGSSTLQKV